MLVLSRRPDERIVFPNLGVTVHILRVAGNIVRIGVDAPPEVRVMRHELLRDRSNAVMTESPNQTRRNLRHLFKNALNVATVAAQLAKRQIAHGKREEAEETLDRAIRELEAMNRQNERSGKCGASATAAYVPRSQRYALLVEDNPNECELLAGYLRTSGFEVDTAGDGLEALNRLSENPRRPDAVLLDVQLPRLDGAGTITSIRNNPQLQGLKVFAVTGTSQADSGISVGPNGVDRWFPKPINPTELVAHMESEFAGAAC